MAPRKPKPNFVPYDNKKSGGKSSTSKPTRSKKQDGRKVYDTKDKNTYGRQGW